MRPIFIRTSSIVGVAALSLAIASAAFFPRESHASAPGTTPVTGWGWSDTVGWISFDCSDLSVCGSNDYGIGVDGSGNLSGYAWSDNIGWVSAEASDLTGCPTAPCTATLVDGVLSGWMKAMAANGDGWDGWISLKGTGYGPTVASGDFSGYAWGSDVVGWIDFSQVHTTYVTDVCPNIAGTQTTVPDDYALQGGICVKCNYTCPTLTSVHNSCTDETTQCDGGLACAVGSRICVTPPPPSFISSAGGLTGHLQARPQIVPKGNPTMLYWNVENVPSCTVTGGGQTWSGTAAPSGGQQTANINQRTTFTLTCQRIDAGAISESVVVGIVPTFKEQ